MMEFAANAGTSTAGIRACGRFIDRLLLLPLSQWCDVAARAPVEVDREAARALTEALSETADAWDLWSMRDDLDTAFYRFECAEGRLLLRHVKLPHVRRITERAADSLIVRAALAPAVFDILYGPFGPAIPVTVI